MRKKTALFAFFVCWVVLSPLVTESFAQDGNAGFEVRNGVLIKYRGFGRTASIPGSLGVSRIGERAFAGTQVEVVSIPIGVSFIDERAFAGCSFLKTVALPNTLISIGRRAFFNCVLLENVNIPYSLKSIEEGAFFNCISLKEIDLPDTIKSIGQRAFSGCTGLGKVSLSRRTKLGDHAFMGVPCEIFIKD